MTDTGPNYFLSKKSLKEIYQIKAKDWSRNNIYNSCGWYTQKGLKEGRGIKVDLMLLEQKGTSSLVHSEIKG